MAKEIRYANDARTGMLNGVNKLANAVKMRKVNYFPA